MGLVLADYTMKSPPYSFGDAKGVCLIIDGDLLVYRVGFAGQSSQYEVSDTFTPTTTFSSKKEAEEFCRAQGVDYSAIRKNIEVIDEALIKNRMNTMLDKIRNDVDQELRHVTGFPANKALDWASYIFLTGCDQVENFREEVDPGYKANRSPSSKPVMYKQLREYLQNETAHITITTQGAEADDYLSQAAADVKKVMPETMPIIVSIDKDLDMIPGWHYNFVKNSLYYINDLEAHKFFFLQMLMGDAADNIKGLHRVGPVKAAKILKAQENFYDLDADQITSWQRECERQYKDHFGSEIWQQKWNNNCDLLWIWRKIPDDCPFKVATSEPNSSEAVNSEDEVLIGE